MLYFAVYCSIFVFTSVNKLVSLPLSRGTSNNCVDCSCTYCLPSQRHTEKQCELWLCIPCHLEARPKKSVDCGYVLCAVSGPHPKTLCIAAAYRLHSGATPQKVCESWLHIAVLWPHPKGVNTPKGVAKTPPKGPKTSVGGGGGGGGRLGQQHFWVQVFPCFGFWF